jgi:hypothetical protein
MNTNDARPWTPPEVTTPSPPPPRKRHRIRTTLIVIGSILGGFLIFGGILTAVAGPSGTPVSTAPSVANNPSNPSPPPAPTTPPPPAANPDGTYQGSCDYILGDDPVGGFGPGTAKLIGEIDLANTGNVGVIVRTRITWPQEGAAPITARKTVHLPNGADKVVRFSVPMTGDQVDLLQSWQERHGFKDGCTYHAAFTSTYGQVH